MDNYLCVDFLCFAQTKLHVTSKGLGFENITYNYVSGKSIPELLMKIITCHLFVNDMKLSVILSCRSKVVDYYPQKWFVLHKKKSGDPLAMIAYCLGIPPLIWDLWTAHLKVTHPWYSDDAEIGGTLLGM